MQVLTRFLALGFAGLYHLVFFGLLLPIGAWRSKKRIESRRLPPKKRYFTSVIVQQAIFAGLSLWVAWATGLVLFPTVRLMPGPLAAAATFLVGAVLLLRPRWRAKVRERDRRVYLFMPRDATEGALWVGIALTAGIGEELAYRGVMYQLLHRATGSVGLSVALAVIAFGLGHLVQGWRSSAIIGFFALGFHGLVLWTGSLYLAMAVHVTYDVVAGFSYAAFGKELGYPLNPEPIESATDSPARTPS